MKEYLIAGVVAGVLAAIINNIYHLTYSGVTGVEVPQVINVLTVSFASLIPLVLASLAYYFLAENTKQPTVIFVIMTIFLTICSMGMMAVPVFPNRDAVPEGFYGLALPMHFIAGGIAAIFIPQYVAYRENKLKVKEHA
ncbi:hypothetical protein [Catalinimonas niigatensis]|uniref:hypothetical protein n=1 Tax=Catalinimonas niigatensis TaxID=1397264 RepID=UPI002666EC97|nr:hypothetical protein [Catalinimonas niigatensis]WPP52598.1 hypothetical protein PZB72_09415 [Catalinimonas niigatensis]